MEKPFRTLEINVISCENLRRAEKNEFVTIRTDSETYQTTKVDFEGGSYPFWDEKLYINMPVYVKFITVEVQCKTASKTRLICSAAIPVSDFCSGCLPENYLHFLSYRLRDPNGSRNGIINLSIRVNQSQQQYKQPCLDTPVGVKGSTSVVIGIPVGYKFG